MSKRTNDILGIPENAGIPARKRRWFVFGLAALVTPFVGWIIGYLFYQVRAGGDGGLESGLSLSLMLILSVGIFSVAGLAFAVTALVRRERFVVLPIVGIVINFVGVLQCYHLLVSLYSP